MYVHVHVRTCILIEADLTSCFGVFVDDVILVVIVVVGWHPENTLTKDLRERAKLQDWTLSLKTLRPMLIDGTSIDHELHWNFLKNLILVALPIGYKSGVSPKLGNRTQALRARHVRSIGVGSFGSVRMVEHVKTGARYALKRIKKVSGKAWWVEPEGSIMFSCMKTLKGNSSSELLEKVHDRQWSFKHNHSRLFFLHTFCRCPKRCKKNASCWQLSVIRSCCKWSNPSRSLAFEECFGIGGPGNWACFCWIFPFWRKSHVEVAIDIYELLYAYIYIHIYLFIYFFNLFICLSTYLFTYMIFNIQMLQVQIT